MRRLAEMARKYGFALVLVTHLNKDRKGARPAIYRSTGSIAVAASARSVLCVSRHPRDGDRRVLSVVKLNVGQPAPSLAFDLAPAEVTVEAEDGPETTSAPVIEWGEALDETADELLQQTPARSDNTGSKAREYLLSRLGDGASVPLAELEGEAEARGVSRSSLHRARAALGVLSSSPGGGKPTSWSLPATPPAG